MNVIVALCLATVLVTAIITAALLVAEFRIGFCSEHVRMTRVREDPSMLPVLTVLIAEQVVRLGRVVFPPVIDAVDRFERRVLREIGGRLRPAKIPDVHVRGVRPPTVISTKDGHRVQIDFVLRNTGAAGSVSYWIEFPIDELHDRETTTHRLFTSDRKMVQVPALTVQRVRDEFTFPPHSVPLATAANKVSVRALVSP